MTTTKELSLQEMENLQGGELVDCIGSVAGSVAVTLALGTAIGLSGGTLSVPMLGIWLGMKTLATGAIVANCTD